MTVTLERLESLLEQVKDDVVAWRRHFQKDIVYPHHHPRFTIDEDALSVGVKAFVHVAFKLLGGFSHISKLRP